VISTPTILVVPSSLATNRSEAKLPSPCQEEINETQKLHKDGVILCSSGTSCCDLRHTLLCSLFLAVPERNQQKWSKIHRLELVNFSRWSLGGRHWLPLNAQGPSGHPRVPHRRRFRFHSCGAGNWTRIAQLPVAPIERNCLRSRDFLLSCAPKLSLKIHKDIEVKATERNQRRQN